MFVECDMIWAFNDQVFILVPHLVLFVSNLSKFLWAFCFLQNRSHFHSFNARWRLCPDLPGITEHNQSQGVPSTMFMGCSKKSKRALPFPKKFILGPAQGCASATVTGLSLETTGFCANCQCSFPAIILFYLLQVTPKLKYNFFYPTYYSYSFQVLVGFINYPCWSRLFAPKCNQNLNSFIFWLNFIY